MRILPAINRIRESCIKLEELMVNRYAILMTCMFAAGCAGVDSADEDSTAPAASPPVSNQHISRIFFTVTDGPTTRHSDAGGDLKIGQIIDQARAKAAGGSTAPALAP
jgi:hypothetical protein